jgi:hypothetical protein
MGAAGILCGHGLPEALFRGSTILEVDPVSLKRYLYMIMSTEMRISRVRLVILGASWRIATWTSFHLSSPGFPRRFSLVHL